MVEVLIFVVVAGGFASMSAARSHREGGASGDDNNRFYDAFSRPGNEFNSACAEGRFLIISHLERNYSNKISRELCLSLNEVAREVAE